MADIIGTLIPIVFILTIGGVLILRPLSRRLGDLLEALAAEKREGAALEPALTRLQHSLDALDDRLTLLEERQEFTDNLLRGRDGADAGRLESGLRTGSPTRRTGGKA